MSFIPCGRDALVVAGSVGPKKIKIKTQSLKHLDVEAIVKYKY